MIPFPNFQRLKIYSPREKWLPLPLIEKQFKLQSPVTLHKTEAVMGGKYPLLGCPIALNNVHMISSWGPSEQMLSHFLNRNVGPLYIHWKFRKQIIHKYFQACSFYSKFSKCFSSFIDIHMVHIKQINE